MAPLIPIAASAAVLGLLGAIIGSFVAALVIRWPQGRSVIGGRSACDACGHVLRARDLLPIASFAARRGRCRDCGAAIDRRHPAIEVAALAIGVAAALVAPLPDAIAGAVFGWILLALVALDLAEMWLPDRLTLTLAIGGVVTGALGAWPPLTDRMIGGAAGFGGLWLIGFGYERLRGRQGLGGGDPKLLGGIGLWLGWRMLPGVLLFASLIGLAIAAWRWASGRAVARDAAVPFGAYLGIAAYLAWLAMIGMGI